MQTCKPHPLCQVCVIHKLLLVSLLFSYFPPPWVLHTDSVKVLQEEDPSGLVRWPRVRRGLIPAPHPKRALCALLAVGR